MGDGDEELGAGWGTGEGKDGVRERTEEGGPAVLKVQARMVGGVVSWVAIFVALVWLVVVQV